MANFIFYVKFFYFPKIKFKNWRKGEKIRKHERKISRLRCLMGKEEEKIREERKKPKKSLVWRKKGKER